MASTLDLITASCIVAQTSHWNCPTLQNPPADPQLALLGTHTPTIFQPQHVPQPMDLTSFSPSATPLHCHHKSLLGKYSQFLCSLSLRCMRSAKPSLLFTFFSLIRGSRILHSGLLASPLHSRPKSSNRHLLLPGNCVSVVNWLAFLKGRLSEGLCYFYSQALPCLLANP